MCITICIKVDSHCHLVEICICHSFCLCQQLVEIRLHAAPMHSSPSLSTNLDHLSFPSPKEEKLHFMWLCFPDISARFFQVPQTHLVDPYQIWRHLAGDACHLHETSIENKDATVWFNLWSARLSTAPTASPEHLVRQLFCHSFVLCLLTEEDLQIKVSAAGV